MKSVESPTPVERPGRLAGAFRLTTLGWVSGKTRRKPMEPPTFFFHKLSGWWYTYPSGKYESQLGLVFPIYGK